MRLRPRDSCYVRIIDALETPRISLIRSSGTFDLPVNLVIDFFHSSRSFGVIFLRYSSSPCNFLMASSLSNFSFHALKDPTVTGVPMVRFSSACTKTELGCLCFGVREDNLPPRPTALFPSRVVFVLQALSELVEKVVHEDGIPK